MKRVIVGIGNPGRSDDAIGCIIAERLKSHFDKVVVVHTFLPEDLLSIRGFDEMVIVDGAVTIPEAEVRGLSVDDLPGTQSSTHFIELGDLLNLGRKLYDDFPKKISVIGVGIRDTDFADGLSPLLAEKLDEICQKVLRLA